MISPLVLFFGAGAFLISLAIHILIWRIIKPDKQSLWLIAIFLILPMLISIILFYIFNPFDVLSILLWHFLLSVAYILSYPPIQVMSPSLKIILAVSVSMPDGMTAESIENIFCEDTLSGLLNNLVNDGLVFLENDKIIISTKGRLLSAIFSAYRHLLGLPQGEG